MNDLVCTKLEEVVELQVIIRKDDLKHKSKREKNFSFAKYSLPIVF